MRLIGIDLFRIIAAFGVIIIHGLGGIPMDNNASQLGHIFSAFSVPFFLATAFYLAGISLQSKPNKFSLKKRMQRILVPFACWTAIYLVARAAKQFILNDHSFNKLISDPIGLLFGSAGVQLYFLPMLATGTVIIFLIVEILNIRSLKYLAILATISLMVLGWLQSTDNLFKLGQGIALIHLFPDLYTKPGFREVFVLISWILSCLPYIFLSLILLNFHVKSILESRQNLKVSLPISIILIVVSLSIIHLNGSNAYLNIFLSYATLIFGLCISSSIRNLIFIQNLGRYTFGIYLVHALFTDGLAPLLEKVNSSLVPNELSLASLLIVSSTIFGLSLVLTFLISLHKISSRVLLGI